MSYYNGTSYNFTWEGRRLVGAVKGTKTMSFTYNDEGIRTSKTVNGVKHTYYLNGSLIMAEQWEDKLLVYLYDVSGSPIGMMYRTESYASDAWDTFWYEKNLFGDIVAIYNESGTKVATYTYSNAWGNHSVSYSNGGGSTGAQYNPFRYRGYYYDTDLGMYYLQSRYYDSSICRFINADGYVSTGQGIIGNNMFAYCGNNPVNRVDPTGDLWFAIAIVAVMASTVLIGHVVAGVNIIVADNIVDSLEKNNSQSEAPLSNEEMINKYLNEKYGSDVSVNISNDNAKITNGSDVNFRDRMVISVLLAKNGYSSRSAVNLAAEWEAHNIVDFIAGGNNDRARNVDLDSNFANNEWYTICGTIICHIVGWY